MVPCLRFSSSCARTTNSHASPTALQGNIFDDTPISSVQPSPTVNLTREYTLAVQTYSYSEMWSIIHSDSHSDENIETGQVELPDESQLLEQVLRPSHDCVLEALSHIKPNALTELVADYFKHTESISRWCLSILHRVHRARLFYAPLNNLLDVLPIDLDSSTHSLTESQCERAFDIFLQVDPFDNPFRSPGNYDFNDMHRCFSQLKQQLGHRLHKSRSRIQLFRRAIPLCASCLLSNITRKELSCLAQLDAAARGTYVLLNELETIDRLVARLDSAFESDKLLVRLGLEMARDRHSVQEVLKQLHKTRSNFLQQLTDLDEHLCLCFTSVNWARSIVLLAFPPNKENTASNNLNLLG